MGIGTGLVGAHGLEYRHVVGGQGVAQFPETLPGGSPAHHLLDAMPVVSGVVGPAVKH